MSEVIISANELQQIGARITDGVGQIIEQSRRTIAVYLNSEISITYWRIGKYIADELDAVGFEKYGSKIVGTLSRQLSWSHFIELAEVKELTKRLFYQQMSIVNGWSVRQLRDQEDAMAYERTLIATKPEEEQLYCRFPGPEPCYLNRARTARREKGIRSSDPP